MANFITQIDFSTQVKEYQNTEGTLSGSVNINQYTTLGTDYADLPLGLDLSTTGITATYTPIINGYFTGTTGSTTFYFSDPNMDIANPSFSAITSSNSGNTQYGSGFQSIYGINIDGNYFDVYFSGVSFDMTPVNLDEYIPGEFSGITFTNVLNYLSGSTYGWWFLKSGSTTWNEIKGRLQTDRITITESATTGYVLTCLDSSGNAVWQPSSSNIFTGGTGSCIADLYVTNIHACSPLNINPLDEGNVYFGSTSGITIDVTNKRLGINNNNPNYVFDINSSDNNSKFYYLEPLSNTQYVSLSGNSSMFIGVSVNTALSSTPVDGGIVTGMIGENNSSYPGYGSPLDTFLYASANANRLNIVNAPTFSVGTNTDDIRFYAGQFVNSGFGSDIHINGSGVNRGFVGIGNESPTQKLHISGNTRSERNFDGDVSIIATNTNVGGTLARGVIAASAIADSLGRTLSGLFAVSGYNTDIPGFGDGGTDYLKNALTITVAGNDPRGDINIGTRNPGKFLRFFAEDGAPAVGDFDSTTLRGSLNSSGYWGFGQNMTGQTSTVDIKGTNGYDQFRLRTQYTVTSSGDTNGNIGDTAWDDNYFYIKTNLGWGRIGLDYTF